MFKAIGNFFSPPPPPPTPSLVPKFSSNSPPPKPIVNTENWDYETQRKKHMDESRLVENEIMSPVLYGKNGKTWSGMRWNQTAENIQKMLEPVSLDIENKLFDELIEKTRKMREPLNDQHYKEWEGKLRKELDAEFQRVYTEARAKGVDEGEAMRLARIQRDNLQEKRSDEWIAFGRNLLDKIKEEEEKFFKERFLLKKQLQERVNKYIAQRLREEKIMTNEMTTRRNKYIEKNVRDWDKELQEREAMAQARGKTLFKPLTPEQEETLREALQSNRYRNKTEEEKEQERIQFEEQMKKWEANRAQKNRNYEEKMKKQEEDIQEYLQGKGLGMNDYESLSLNQKSKRIVNRAMAKDEYMRKLPVFTPAQLAYADEVMAKYGSGPISNLLGGKRNAKTKKRRHTKKGKSRKSSK